MRTRTFQFIAASLIASTTFFGCADEAVECCRFAGYPSCEDEGFSFDTTGGIAAVCICENGPWQQLIPLYFGNDSTISDWESFREGMIEQAGLICN
jgi:hypothetical protein